MEIKSDAVRTKLHRNLECRSMNQGKLEVVKQEKLLPLENEMATHSSVLAWRIPGMGEPGGLPSMESHKVGHD